MSQKPILKDVRLGSSYVSANCVGNNENYIYHTVRLTIWHHLFLKFWLVDTWFFAHWRHQRAVTRLEIVGQLNIRRSKKLGFQLSHRPPLYNKKSKVRFLANSKDTLRGWNRRRHVLVCLILYISNNNIIPNKTSIFTIATC